MVVVGEEGEEKEEKEEEERIDLSAVGQKGALALGHWIQILMAK